MAEPTINYVPKTADAKMFQDTANDKSIASAVKGTHAGSVLYSNFDDLRNNCITALLDSTNGGPQHVTPTNTGAFRGYPKSTLSMNYTVIEIGSAPAVITEALTCLPTLNNKLGFAITFYVTVQEELLNDTGLNIHDEWFTFNAGSTSVSSSSISIFSGGKYVLSEDAPTASWDLSIECFPRASTPSTYDAYRPSENTYTGIMEYTPQELAYSHTLTPNVSSLNCVNSGSGGSTAYYSDDSYLATNSVIYTNNLLTTPLSTAEKWEEGVSTPSAGRLLIDMNSSGVVTSTLFCPDA